MKKEDLIMDHFFSIIPYDAQNKQLKSVTFQGIPDECPICHNKMTPLRKIATAAIVQKKMQVIFQCTNHQCEQVFIGTYYNDVKASVFYLKDTAPKHFIPKNFSEEVIEISSNFVNIYNQAVEAESNLLNEIAGIGYRKSIEFLVKDYLIHIAPTDEVKIKKMRLGNCIDEYIKDQNILTCVKRATWLGNDETHYIRKWEDKDIEDLKLLIKLSVNWIESSLLTEKYAQEMPE